TTMTIGKRLMVLLAVPLVALLAFGIFARIQLSKIEQHSRFVAESQLASVAALGNISGSFAELRVNLRDLMLAADRRQQAAAAGAFNETERGFPRLLQQFGDSLISDERTRRFFGDFRELSRQYIVEAKRVVALVESGRRDDAIAYFRSSIGPI